ncbi:hypothetical protein WJX75_007302 [Coccomyxa subellipsoidea]|uniref:Sugar phosphate transporter domain-containing protein n=1 Tax=Coccomyxa subellipsoidea TaxID=248742 RepID=A0ABR2YV90_9CHLO
MNDRSSRENGDKELQPILEEEEEEEESKPQSPHETTRSRLRNLAHNSIFRTAAKNLALICTWYFFSTLLSLWNRTLLGKGHGVLGKGAFPAPMLMSSLQFAAQIVMAKAVLSAGIVKRQKPAELTWKEFFVHVVPNGAATGLDIGLSNFSLSLITLSFYTMCKSTTPVFLLGFCFLWGIERPSWNLALVVVIISFGLGLLVAGETDFNLAGFVIVMVASALSGLRWTITQVLLQGNDAHGTGASGGPVEVLLALMPVMSVTVAILSLVIERLWIVLPGSPYFDSIQSLASTTMLMLFGGTIAFFMVWTEFTVIAETSALTFMVAGTFKEIVTVMAAVTFLGESFSFINGVGLVVLIMGVALFNYNKYQKILSGQAPGSRKPASVPAKDSLDDVESARLVNGGPRLPVGASPRASPRAGLSASLELSSHRSLQHPGGNAPNPRSSLGGPGPVQ